MYSPLTLNYSLDGLEPIISGETMFIHYEKLYKKYLSRLNDLLSKNNYNFNNDKLYLISIINEFNNEDREKLKFNLGGVINHELYFDNLNKSGNHRPSGQLLEAINRNFGSFDKFKEEFKESANNIMGSGYTFLVVDNMNNLKIMNLSNQDSPYFYNYIPIFNLDIWEHAYFLDYLNKKDEYIDNYFQIVDFDKVNEKYQEAINKL